MQQPTIAAALGQIRTKNARLVIFSFLFLFQNLSSSSNTPYFSPVDTASLLISLFYRLVRLTQERPGAMFDEEIAATPNEVLVPGKEGLSVF